MADEQSTTQGGSGSTDAGATGQQQTGKEAASTSSTADNKGTQQTSQQTSSQGTGQTGSPTAFTYKEDRSDWMPRHRFNEVSTKNKDYETQISDLTRKLTIALGGEVKSPDEAKAAQIKDAFFKLPGMGALRKLSELSEEQLDSLLSVPQHVSQNQEAEFRQWQRHGNQQIETVSDKVAEAIGTDTLDNDQKTDLRNTFSSWLKTRSSNELQQAIDRYGEEAVARDQRRFSDTIRRYEDGDPKLLDEFVTRYTKNWVEPARRSATARTSTRTRPVPDSSGRTPVTSIQRPASFKNLDERIEYASNLAKERGVQFGR
jgi:hypothetical protein